MKGKFSQMFTSHDLKRKTNAREDVSDQVKASQVFCHSSPADCEKRFCGKEDVTLLSRLIAD